MKATVMSVILVQLVLISPLRTSADTFNCDGVWSDLPCGVSRPSADSAISSSARTNQPNKTQGIDRALKVKSGDSTGCPADTILIATRPEPVGRWLVEKQRSSSKEEISIKGSVRGHGKVGIDITGAHNLDGRPQNKRLFSQIVTLPADGGEKNFEARFTLYTGWSWNMLLANKGIFAGYCSTESQQLVNAKRQADEVKQMAEQALANSNTAVDLASDR